MTRFADPLWFALALAVAARVALVVRDRRQRVGAFGYSSLALVAPAPGLRVMTAALPFALETLAMLLLVVALARPQRVVRLAASDRYGIDIVVALDASGSMAAEDFRPRNRFAVAKELIGDFIRRRTDDRIGIVTFGSRAATRVPITYDRRIIEAVLAKAEIGEHGNGTAIGHALATAVNRLRNSKTRSRVVILVTDGVNNSGSIDPLVAAQLAAAAGIKVYTIGVGSEGPVPLPVKRQNPFTGAIETIYTHIRGELDEKTLEAIASTTGGAFFRATDAQALGAVLKRIDALEKTRLTAPKREQIDELYVWPLGAALALLALSLLGGETLWLKVPA
ncbi:MAG: VWA domain-containing protein [Acidobacteria bacterium]|nr:VWA domain-containing protein [Acidobacteriota bacterium]MBV9474839.1 VWA domain-containing protein [Acidobacteriota bacterium]